MYLQVSQDLSVVNVLSTRKQSAEHAYACMESRASHSHVSICVNMHTYAHVIRTIIVAAILIPFHETKCPMG